MHYDLPDRPGIAHTSAPSSADGAGAGNSMTTCASCVLPRCAQPFRSSSDGAAYCCCCCCCCGAGASGALLSVTAIITAWRIRHLAGNSFGRGGKCQRTNSRPCWRRPDQAQARPCRNRWNVWAPRGQGTRRATMLVSTRRARAPASRTRPALHKSSQCSTAHAHTPRPSQQQPSSRHLQHCRRDRDGSRCPAAARISTQPSNRIAARPARPLLSTT